MKFKKMVVTQCNLLFSKRNATIGFLLVFALMSVNYILNVFEYRGTDISDMYHLTTLLLLGGNNVVGFYFLQIYPILVVLPASFSFMQDREANIAPLFEARVGKGIYFLSKSIAVFLVTYAIFTLPLFLEYFFSVFSFPLEAQGDPSNYSYFAPERIEMVHGYFLSEMYVINPFLYTAIRIVLFGVTSGILALFALAISNIKIIKYKVFLFLPVYCVLYILTLLGQYFKSSMSTNYFFYLLLFDSTPKSDIGFFLVLAILLLVACILLIHHGRKGEYS